MAIEKALKVRGEEIEASFRPARYDQSAFDKELVDYKRFAAASSVVEDLAHRRGAQNAIAMAVDLARGTGNLMGRRVAKNGDQVADSLSRLDDSISADEQNDAIEYLTNKARNFRNRCVACAIAHELVARYLREFAVSVGTERSLDKLSRILTALTRIADRFPDLPPIEAPIYLKVRAQPSRLRPAVPENALRLFNRLAVRP